MNPWRIRISKFLAYKSLSSLVIAAILIAWALIYSLIIGDWPFRYWNDWPMNHGPWRYDFGFIPNPRRHQLEYALELIFYSMPISFLAMSIKLGKFTIAVSAISVIAFGLFLYYLYWLID